MIGLLISPLLIIMIFLVILFSVFILKMHIDFTKKNSNNTCGQEIFSSKKQTKKNLFIKKLGILGRIKTKNDPTDRRRPHTKPHFYSYVPFDDSVFLTRTKKLTKKKNSFFQFCLFLKKREKNLKEKKNPSELLYSSLDDYFFDHFNYKYARWHFLNVFNLIY